MEPSDIQKALIAALKKLHESHRITDEEFEWLRGSLLLLVAEFSVLKNKKERPTGLEGDLERRHKHRRVPQVHF